MKIVYQDEALLHSDCAKHYLKVKLTITQWERKQKDGSLCKFYHLKLNGQESSRTLMAEIFIS